MHDVFHRI